MNQIKIVGSAINALSYFSSDLAAKLAIKIFSTPRNAKLNEEGIQYLSSAEQMDVTCDGFQVKTYQWKGNHKTVLLVHGWDSNSFRWKNFIELLKQDDYNIISIDAPAHGASGSKIFNAPLYAKCLDVVINQYKPEIVVGHSVGGTAIVIAQETHNLPSIEKLVLLGAPSNLGISVKNYTTMMGYNHRVAEAMNRYYLKYFGHLPEYYCVENFYSNINAKGLIIHDKKDQIISFREALDIKRVYKNSELVKTNGYGHRLRSEKVYQHILDFLNA
ncbi:alpha/beta fold hydrolase [Tamlana flava]|uniref:alpha/beta fold hydrolase n=1 Tax=Tamlana flava TaxID=3158572 RepID=UPI00351ACAE8